MFVGHFAIAFLLWRLLVPAGIEKVRINPDSPLQKFIVFEKFPYSHSLVLGSALSLPIGLLIAGVLNNPVIVPVFVAGSASPRLLDTSARLKDLPGRGFDGARKVGAGLWKRAPRACARECALYAIVTTLA